MNGLKQVFQAGSRRARWTARVFVGVAAVLILSSCGLFRAIASAPEDTPAVISTTAARPTAAAEQDPATPGAGPIASRPVGPANLLYWSPANGSLALAGENEVRVMPLPQQGIQAQGLDAVPERPLPAAEPTILTGAQEAPRLAWVDSENQVFTADISAADAAAVVVKEDKPVTGLAVSPDGSNLAVVTTDGNLSVIPQVGQPSGQSVQAFELPAWLTQLSFSPDGKLIGGADLRNFTVYLVDAQTGNVVRTLEWFDSPTASLYGAFFAPDWSRVAWVAQTAVQLMNVVDGTKGPALNHEDHVSALAWSPDGTRLATVSVTHTGAGPVQVILVWEAATGQLVTTLPQASAVRSLAFSPDGKQIAVIDNQQNLQMWNLE